MKKLEANQGKMLSELYSKSQILAAALYFFGTIDDIDFKAMENIIRRKLGLSVGVPAIDKPLYDSIESLRDHIVVKEETDDIREKLHYYTSKRIVCGKDLILKEESISFMDQTIPKDLYDVMGEIYHDSVELMVRRVSLDPRFPAIRTHSKDSDYNFALGAGFIENSEYELTKNGINKLAAKNQLAQATRTIKKYNKARIVSDELCDLRRDGSVRVSELAITKLGRVFLLARDNEDTLNFMGNVLTEKGFEGYYMDRYLTSIYDLEMAGRIKSFTDWLTARQYLEYCRENRLDDCIKESEIRHGYSAEKRIWMR